MLEFFHCLRAYSQDEASVFTLNNEIRIPGDLYDIPKHVRPMPPQMQSTKQPSVINFANTRSPKVRLM